VKLVAVNALWVVPFQYDHCLPVRGKAIASLQPLTRQYATRDTAVNSFGTHLLLRMVADRIGCQVVS